MADFLIFPQPHSDHQVKAPANDEKLSIDLPNGFLLEIWGTSDTYSFIKSADDFLLIIGFASHVSELDTREAMARVLSSFKKTDIGLIKEAFIGEYVFLIKKGPELFLFSDFVGTRNIFFSKDMAIASSSYSCVEAKIDTGSDDLNPYKYVEFIAMRHVLYPSWLGSSTYNERISWLLPYEYLVINLEKREYRTESLSFILDNERSCDKSLLSNELLSILRNLVNRKEFGQSKIVATITGGHDSRLIAALVLEAFGDHVRFRTAVSRRDRRSLKDMKIATKLAKSQNVPHDIFWFSAERDAAIYQLITEGFSPLYNETISPLIEGAGDYSLGFGGAFGTELFMPIPWASIDAFIQNRINASRIHMHVGDAFWSSFREAIYDQFGAIKEHYYLNRVEERDYIRLFCLLVTARYGSFLFSAFNRYGRQFDPYATSSVLRFAVRVAPALWGNHRSLKGKNLIQKEAMSKLNATMGSMMAYQHYRPMLPLTLHTFPKYSWGLAIQVAQGYQGRLKSRLKHQADVDLPGGTYRTDGWDANFVSRTQKAFKLRPEELSKLYLR